MMLKMLNDVASTKKSGTRTSAVLLKHLLTSQLEILELTNIFTYLLTYLLTYLPWHLSLTNISILITFHNNKRFLFHTFEPQQRHIIHSAIDLSEGPSQREPCFFSKQS